MVLNCNMMATHSQFCVSSLPNERITIFISIFSFLTMAVKFNSKYITDHLQFSLYKLLNGKINSLIIMFCAKCFVFFNKRLFVSDSQYALYISCFADTWHLQFSFYTPQGTRAKIMYTKLTYAHNFCFLSKIQMMKREL